MFKSVVKPNNNGPLTLQHPPNSPDMSPCDYELFAKVKEPLRETRYNTREELFRATRRSIRNIKKDGRPDGLPVNKAVSEISNCCHYFSSAILTSGVSRIWLGGGGGVRPLPLVLRGQFLLNINNFVHSENTISEHMAVFKKNP